MRRLLVSLLIIALVGWVAASGVGSYFSDNTPRYTFADGEIVLDLDGGGSVTGTWVMTGMLPGTSQVVATLTIVNKGSVSANRTLIQVENAFIESTPQEESDTSATATDLDKYLEITALTYPNSGTSILGLINNGNGNTFVDLDDFENNDENGVNLDLMPGPAADYGSVILGMTLKLHESASNDYQGDTVNMTMTVTIQSD